MAVAELAPPAPFREVKRSQTLFMTDTPVLDKPKVQPDTASAPEARKNSLPNLQRAI